MTDDFDATKCPKCGDTWQIHRVRPAVPNAVAVDLRICSCDFPCCRNAKCKRPIQFTAKHCQHCGTRV